MNNKGVGAIFCLISAILTSARYLSAAIFMSGLSSWSEALFSNGLQYVGSPLKLASVAALLAGISFLAVGLYQDARKKPK